MTTHIYLTRHARTIANEAQTFQGWLPGELSLAGRTDADLVADWWADKSVDWVVASPLARTMAAAELLFGRVDEIDAAFVECAMPTLDGHTYAAALAYPELFDPVTNWPRSDRPPSPVIESRAAVMARVEAGCLRLRGTVDDGGSVAVVTHGGVLLAVLALLGIDGKVVPNLAVLELVIEDGDVAAATLLDPLTGNTEAI